MSFATYDFPYGCQLHCSNNKLTVALLTHKTPKKDTGGNLKFYCCGNLLMSI
jgi:hypothetical protein